MDVSTETRAEYLFHRLDVDADGLLNKQARNLRRARTVTSSLLARALYISIEHDGRVVTLLRVQELEAVFGGQSAVMLRKLVRCKPMHLQKSSFCYQRRPLSAFDADSHRGV